MTIINFPIGPRNGNDVGTELVLANLPYNFKAMTKPFEINFDFPVALSDLKISLKATAELHHSEPYFLVHNFFMSDKFKNEAHHHSILPDQEVKRIKKGQDFTWVHRDSGRESLLSLAIGVALEENISADELADITATN